MLRSRLLLRTRKEAPTDATADSHKLLVRAGLFRAAGGVAGLWETLPCGLRVLDKLQREVDDVMQNELGAQKLEMPSLSGAETWKKTKRFEGFGKEMFKFKDRSNDDLLLCPTHEEPFAALVAETFGTLPKKSTPLLLYQIGRKFRDELRPRAGLLRAREFLMKDLYTFHADRACAFDTYDKVRAAYSRLFRERLETDVVCADADSESMGGQLSHEFHLPAPAGEDDVLCCDTGSYAANVEAAFFPSRPGEPDEVYVASGGVRVRVPKGRTAVPHLVERFAKKRKDAQETLDAVQLNIVQAVEGDACVDRGCLCSGKGRLVKKRCIEVGHSFFLGTFYSQALGVRVDGAGLDGKSPGPAQMSSYGLGMTRILAALCETKHDEHGIVWPKRIAPFRVVLLAAPSADADFVSSLFLALKQKFGADCLYDDRDGVTMAVKTADAKLLGVPRVCTVGRRGVEILDRKTGRISIPPANDDVQAVLHMIDYIS